MRLDDALANIDDATLTDFTQQLIRLDSMNPPGQEQAVADEFARQGRDWGLEVTVEYVVEGRPNVLVRLPGGGAPTLLYCGHLDTVPPGGVPWEHEPLSGDLVGDQLWGRGASDMKSGLTSMLAAMAALRQADVRLPGDLVLAAVVGEEVDCAGSRHYLAQGGMDGVAWLVLSEPTNLDLVVAHRGALWLEATTYGKTAHGSMPHLGTNAIVHMMELVHRVRCWEYPWQPHPLLQPPTLSVNTIAGGVNTNVVPDVCRTTIDIRTLPDQDHGEVLRSLERLADDLTGSVPEFRAEFRVLNDRAPVQTPVDDPLVLAAQAATRIAFRADRPVRGASYYTDASVLQPPTGVPTLIIGPGDDRLAHQPNEFVSVEALVAAARFFTALPLEVYGTAF
jgi:succinyl-diaminopimelate desuccinylase